MIIKKNESDDRSSGRPMHHPDKKTRDYSVFDAELTGQVFNLKLLIRLLGWMKPYRKTLLLALVLVISAAVFAILMQVVVSLVAIDDILLKKSDNLMPDFGMRAVTHWVEGLLGLHPLAAACLLFAVVTVCFAVLGHYARVAIANSVIGALRDLRQDLFTHFEHLPVSFFDRVAVGRAMTRVTNDIEVLFQLLAGFGMLLGEFVPFFVALIIMISISAKLTGILLLAVPVIGIVTYFFRQATRRIYREIRGSVSMLNQNLHENIMGIQVVQLNNRESLNLRDYSAINATNRRYENYAVEVETVYGAFVESMAPFGVAGIIWFGGGEVVQGAISLGSIVMFSQFVDMLFRPIIRLGEQYNILFRAMASGERIFQALDWDEKIYEPVKPVEFPKTLEGHVEFKNVTFGYEVGHPILKDVSFEIQPGEKLAIVGPTGAGKSTIIRLLDRFYDIDHKKIYLDGVDLNDFRARDVRGRIGVVLQDFHVFSGTVKDNIILNNSKVSQEKAEEAVKMVNADRFIRTLPQGYDTPLYERGQNLSHGQRQLLAFARVLAADPEILILDEATGSIDTETELLIQEAMRTVTAGRTSIIIAHRLQTIQEADRILVLQNGRVRETGSHDELIEKEGIYHTLYTLQFQSDSKH